MADLDQIINHSGKGLIESKNLYFTLDINLGGTLGTYQCANRDLSRSIYYTTLDAFYIGKLINTGVIHRSVQPDNGQFETSDLSISLSNSDLKFSEYPWDRILLNRKVDFRVGFSFENNVTDNYMGTSSSLYKGIIKKEERSGKILNLSIGDYTNKIFKDIPPRRISVTEFPKLGTSVKVRGTMTDADTSLIGRGIPYIYGDFSNVSLIQPLFIDTDKKRYLIADHAIGNVSKVISGGTQVYNFTKPNISGYVAGTHITGTNIMSFINFGTSQGTKTVYVSVRGRYSSGNLLENPALIVKDILLSNKICGLSTTDIGTASFDVSQAFLNPYKFRFILDDDIYKNSVELLQNISVNSLSTFRFDKDNKAQFDTYRPAVSRVNIQKIDQTDILEDTFTNSRDISDMYNKIIVNYDYDWINKKYRNAFEKGGTAYISQFDTIRTFTIDSPFIYNQTEASFAGQKWLSKLQAGMNKVNLELPLSKLPIDVNTRLQLTHDEPPSSSGGWVDRLINIVECEIDNRGKKIYITAIDEDEVNIIKKYFLLGNGTAFYRSASTAQRYYGALCGATGTFTNGDIGYILW